MRFVCVYRRILNSCRLCELLGCRYVYTRKKVFFYVTQHNCRVHVRLLQRSYVRFNNHSWRKTPEW